MVASYAPSQGRPVANGRSPPALRNAGMQIVQDSPRQPAQRINSARLSQLSQVNEPGPGYRKQKEWQTVMENLAAANNEVRGELQSEVRCAHQAMAREQRERSEQEAAMVSLRQGLEERLLKTSEEAERMQKDVQDARAREIEGRQKAALGEAASKAECDQLEVALRHTRQELSLHQSTVTARVEEWESKCAAAEALEADAQRATHEARASAVEMCQAMDTNLSEAQGQQIECRRELAQVQAACDARCQRLEVVLERSQRDLTNAEAVASTKQQDLEAKIAAAQASHSASYTAGEQVQNELFSLRQQLVATEDKLQASEFDAQHAVALAKAEVREAVVIAESEAEVRYQELEVSARGQRRATVRTEEAAEKRYKELEERFKALEAERAQAQKDFEMQKTSSANIKQLEDILELAQQKAIKAQCKEAEAIAAADAKCLQMEVTCESSQRDFERVELRQAHLQQDTLSELLSARSQGHEARKNALRIEINAAEKFKWFEDQAEKLRQQEIEAQKLAAHRDATAAAQLDQLEASLQAAQAITEQVEVASAAKMELLEADAASSRAEVEVVKRRAREMQQDKRAGTRWRMDGRQHSQANNAATSSK